MIIMGEVDEWHHEGAVIMLVADIVSKVLLHNWVNVLWLSIRLRMESCGEAE